MINEVRSQKSEVRSECVILRSPFPTETLREQNVRHTQDSCFCQGNLSNLPKTFRLKKPGFRANFFDKQQIRQKIQKWQQTNPNAGYTIIEGLVAMIMVAALMSAVAPIIALSVGTRVQARRIELGSQAARSYIDWVRTDPEDNAPGLLGQEKIHETVAPSSGSLSCENKDGEYCGDLGGNGELFCIDGGDGEGCKISSPTDMIIQAGRSYPDATLGYQLLVRVYRADAFQEASLCPFRPDCPDEGTQQSAVTNAIGNRRLPVVDMTVEIQPKSLGDSFKSICDRIDAEEDVSQANSICP